MWRGARPIARDLVGDAKLRVVTVNWDGLRKRKRRLGLGHLIAFLMIGICEVTASHLRKEELR